MIKSDHQYMNLDVLRESTLDDVSIMKEIMEMFPVLIDEYVEVLMLKLPSKEWQSLFQATHKIRPNISIFGIDKLKDIIHQLEVSFKNETNLDQVDALVCDCLDIFKEVKQELRDELNVLELLE